MWLCATNAPRVIEAVYRELQPFWDTLWRLAARGHWLREKRPIRPDRPDLILRAAAPVPPLRSRGSGFRSSRPTRGTLTWLLEMAPKHVCYPLSPYPIIREFATIVSELKPGIPWHGSQFSGLTYGQGRKLQFLFRDRRTGITIDFSETEWDSLRKLFREAAPYGSDSSVARFARASVWRGLRFSHWLRRFAPAERGDTSPLSGWCM